jgi:hypothetical protein
MESLREVCVPKLLHLQEKHERKLKEVLSLSPRYYYSLLLFLSTSTSLHERSHKTKFCLRTDLSYYLLHS